MGAGEHNKTNARSDVPPFVTPVLVLLGAFVSQCRGGYLMLTVSTKTVGLIGKCASQA